MLQLDAQAILQLKTMKADEREESTGQGIHDDLEQEDDDEMDRASVSTSGMAGIGSGSFAKTAQQSKPRPKSIHVTSQVCP